jgi:hypothetical protein
MKLAAATVLLAPAVFGFAPQQLSFRSRSSLSASTEASTEKKVRRVCSENLSFSLKFTV